MFDAIENVGNFHSNVNKQQAKLMRKQENEKMAKEKQEKVNPSQKKVFRLHILFTFPLMEIDLTCFWQQRKAGKHFPFTFMFHHQRVINSAKAI